MASYSSWQGTRMHMNTDLITNVLKGQLGFAGFVGSDYNGTIEALRNGHVDVALLGPFSYILATTQAPVSVARLIIELGFCSAARARASARINRPSASVFKTSMVLPLR